MKTIMDYFYDLSQIPRGSGNEAEASQMILEFAENLGHKAEIDANNNVYIVKNATEGFENKDAILLQGHIDMVCEKNEGVNHDFLKDPIKFIEKDGFLMADGTTLGADNGTAVAYMMAIMADGNLKHPQIEMLITTEEETGLWGAKAINPEFFTATRMINLDAGPEGVAICGCVGGSRGEITLPKVLGTPMKTTLELKIRGLKGGHSGADIHRGRKSANVLIMQMLKELNDAVEIKISSVFGGDKDNVISREAGAVFTTNAETQAVVNTLSAFTGQLELVEEDREFELLFAEINEPVTVFENTNELLDLALSIKSGPLVMSDLVEGMIVVSCNIGVLSTKNDKFVINTSLRSGSAEEMQKKFVEHQEIAQKYNAKCEFSEGYPGWEYKEKSALRESMVTIYKEFFGKELKAEVIHAGLECGILNEKMPQLDIVAIGPNVEAMHSPDEVLEIGSFERVYEFLIKTLELA